jgi:hypothetical protein
MVAYVYAAIHYSQSRTGLIDEAGTIDVTMWENVATEGNWPGNRLVNAGIDSRMCLEI